MSDLQKLAGLLGMARRAGRLSIGFDAAINAAKDGKAFLLLTSLDASAKTVKECAFIANTKDVSVMTLPFDKAALAAAIGMHKPVAVVAVCDEGFAKAIRPHCNDNSEIKEEDSL